MKKRTFLGASAAALVCFTGTPVIAAKPLIADTLKPFVREQTNEVLGASCKTRLEIIPSRKAERSRTLSVLEFTVAPASSIKGFNFDYFEGPKSPAGSHQLMKVSITRAGKTSVHQFGQNGFYSGEIADGFVFQTVGSSSGRADVITALLSEIARGAESIEVAITNGKDRSTVLSSTFAIKPQ